MTGRERARTEPLVKLGRRKSKLGFQLSAGEGRSSGTLLLLFSVDSVSTVMEPQFLYLTKGKVVGG